MKAQRWITAATAGVFLATALIVAPVFGHHASTPFYDPDRQVEVEGTVTRFVFRNPHAFLYIDVTEASGEVVEWQVELGAPVSLRRTGWTPDTVSVGTMVRVSGQPSRAEGSRGIGGRVRMTGPGGRGWARHRGNPATVIVAGSCESDNPMVCCLLHRLGQRSVNLDIAA